MPRVQGTGAHAVILATVRGLEHGNGFSGLPEEQQPQPFPAKLAGSGVRTPRQQVNCGSSPRGVLRTRRPTRTAGGQCGTRGDCGGYANDYPAYNEGIIWRSAI